ncbi:hypothetical protein [Vibrio barjaei]|uniref:hypothetical protein n=1 Tax=Vibrio barjaei TaxID=1676683 RepID=UPI0022835094|nr:hypothetical protein [Vibrio barjaei]MCY9870427.1 hypothetical protein [Vibrio barjaei]
MEKEYVVWSPDKVEDQINAKLPASAQSANTQTYAGVLMVEEAIGGAVSSNVVTSNIEMLIQACYNETNIELSYHELNKDDMVEFAQAN